MEIYFFIIVLVAIIAGFWFVAHEIKKGAQPKDSQSMLLLQNQMSEISRTLDAKLGENTRIIQQQFGESARIIRDITQELTKVSEGHKQVMSITDQLKNLQDILKNPKQRGILGEYYLETVLKNVLPPGRYQMQYEFKDSVIVDAVIFIKDRIIPIDSKFSLENYNRILEARSDDERERYETAFANDLKTRIDETAKYVKPEEGTLDFAFMFIPSEAVYYDLLINKVGAIKSNTENLLEYAYNKKKVLVVSPTTFLAYLQTVLQGLKALQIEESAKEIRKRVQELGKHLTSYEEYMKKLGGHLGTTVSMYNHAYKELGKIDKDVLRIGGEAIGIEPLAVAAPEREDAE
ncbi:MAG: DNA recombination protein RmuC [Candidatus Liptonbacteria bacterium]|nr:DNA recombination protein RmuC [Candidatus Liptonbacteria bacterium]